MATDDFFRARLDAMIDLKHPLAVLSTRLPWAAIEAVVAPKLGRQTLPAKRLRGEDLLDAYDVEFGGVVNPAGRPRLPIRLMASLLYLKNSFNLSDEELVERCGARVCRRPAGGVAGGTGGRACHHRAGFSVLAAVHVTAPGCSGLNFAGPTAYRIAFGPRAGQKVLTLQGAMPRERGFNQTLFADSNGFSLHASVRWAADDRQALEQLCRYARRCKRPEAAQDRSSDPATRRPGRWSRLDPSICRIDGIGLATRDKPQTAPEKTLSATLSTHNRTQPPSKTDSRMSGAMFGVPRGRKKGV